MIKKIVQIIAAAALVLLMPVQAAAAAYWSGSSVCHPDKQGVSWGITSDKITKITSPGRVYSVSDIDRYSAYMTNEEERVGNSIEDSFYWYNQSRLAYVKLFKVNAGSEISFVFSKEFYVYCAEFDRTFHMLEDGDWMATGDKRRLSSKTAWIMVVFRQVNGDTSLGGGVDTKVDAVSIKNSEAAYVVFEPFKYNFKLNGGKQNGSATDYTKQRLGVNSILLDTPLRPGYKFAGWKADSGKIYRNYLPAEYDKGIFKDTTFTAQWTEITAADISLDKEYAIMEQNCGDTLKLTAKISPSDALDKRITWTSSNPETASVDADGLVTAGVTGEAVITAVAGNAKTECHIYVMGFEVSVPASCEINKKYPIKVNVYNNGMDGMAGRKRVIVDTEQNVSVTRVGDEAVRYNVSAEVSKTGNGNFLKLAEGSYLADTTDSATIYYRLVPDDDINRPGDYKGNVNFSVLID